MGYSGSQQLVQYLHNLSIDNSIFSIKYIFQKDIFVHIDESNVTVCELVVGIFMCLYSYQVCTVVKHIWKKTIEENRKYLGPQGYWQAGSHLTLLLVTKSNLAHQRRLSSLTKIIMGLLISEKVFIMFNRFIKFISIQSCNDFSLLAFEKQKNAKDKYKVYSWTFLQIVFC